MKRGDVLRAGGKEAGLHRASTRGVPRAGCATADGRECLRWRQDWRSVSCDVTQGLVHFGLLSVLLIGAAQSSGNAVFQDDILALGTEQPHHHRIVAVGLSSRGGIALRPGAATYGPDHSTMTDRARTSPHRHRQGRSQSQRSPRNGDDPCPPERLDACQGRFSGEWSGWVRTPPSHHSSTRHANPCYPLGLSIRRRQANAGPNDVNCTIGTTGPTPDIFG